MKKNIKKLITLQLKRIFIFYLLFFCFYNQLFAQQERMIVPKVKEFVVLKNTATILTSSSSISVDKEFYEQANYLQNEIKNQCNIEFSIHVNSKKTGDIMLIKDTIEITQLEMYSLEINGQKVILKAKSVRGFINGMQTLLQLFPLVKSKSVLLKACKIIDYPRFAYRGMHLDVVRHFFSVAFVKKYIDYLTFHKFNTFHWHLTDDQGWRIEILSYPKLNSIGSWRDSTLVGHFFDTPIVYKKERYGGFYTRKEVKEIIKYATIRGITIIPEIDIPGHSRATITAYPEFSTHPDSTWGVAATWGMYNRKNNVLAPTEATFKFLKEIFTEIATLFPSEFIHLGGDECSKLWWKKSASTQNFMIKNGLKDEEALQTYFIEKVSGYLKEKNKKVIGWHEIMEGKLDTSTIVMNWANEAKAIDAANKGFQVIMTPGVPFYFDHYQSKTKKDSLAIKGFNSLEAVYNYEVLPAKIVDKNLSAKILGGQANVWTEYMEYPSKVEYMIFPRMTAMSESLWILPEQKNYNDFLKRLKTTIIPRYKYWKSSWYKNFEDVK
jgi:hexosaminidase